MNLNEIPDLKGGDLLAERVTFCVTRDVKSWLENELRQKHGKDPNAFLRMILDKARAALQGKD
jgi:hypothetical protein